MVPRNEQHRRWWEMRSRETCEWGHVTGPLGLFIFASFENFRVTKCSGCSSKKFKKSFDKVCFKTGNQKHPYFRFDENFEMKGSFLFKHLHNTLIFNLGQQGLGSIGYETQVGTARPFSSSVQPVRSARPVSMSEQSVLELIEWFWYFVKLSNVRNDF